MARDLPRKPFLVAWEQRVLDRSPVMVYTRLHLLVPLCLLAALLATSAGFTLSTERDRAYAYTLLGARDRQALDRLDARQKKIADARARSAKDLAALRAINRLIRDELLIANRAGLSGCVADYFDESLSEDINSIMCRGRTLSNDRVWALFWLTIVVSGLTLSAWTVVQVRDSWMLPHGHPGLWFTPAVTAVVGLVMSPAFVLGRVFYLRAEQAHLPAPDIAGIAHPDPQLLLLMCLTMGVLLSVLILSRLRVRDLAVALGLGTGIVLGYVGVVIIALVCVEFAVLDLIFGDGLNIGGRAGYGLAGVLLLVLGSLIFNAMEPLSFHLARAVADNAARSEALAMSLCPAWILYAAKSGGKAILEVPAEVVMAASGATYALAGICLLSSRARESETTPRRSGTACARSELSVSSAPQRGPDQPSL